MVIAGQSGTLRWRGLLLGPVLSAGEDPVVGVRDRLLERAAVTDSVESLVGAVAAGRGAALLVVGEAGLGKTAVLRHGRDVAARAGLQVGSGGGHPMETALPLAYWRRPWRIWAPGAVILYALLAVLLWPAATDRPAPFVAGRAIGGTAARVLWLILWGSLAYLPCSPPPARRRPSAA